MNVPFNVKHENKPVLSILYDTRLLSHIVKIFIIAVAIMIVVVAITIG